jgi:hypothetical protein
MNYVRLTAEEQRAVCEDLLAIDRAGLIPRLAAVRQQLLREHRPASPWEQVEIARLTKHAVSLIGGTRNYWRDAAAAALGIPSPGDLGIEAVCRVADYVGQQQEEQPARQAAPRARVTIGRKRGGR